MNYDYDYGDTITVTVHLIAALVVATLRAIQLVHCHRKS